LLPLPLLLLLPLLLPLFSLVAAVAVAVKLLPSKLLVHHPSIRSMT
jgi:hypothetical protein